MTTEEQEKTETTVTFLTPVDMHEKFRTLLDEYNRKKREKNNDYKG